MSGVVFVVVFVIAFLLTGDSGDSPSEVTDFYTDAGNQTKQFAAFFIFLASMLAFLWFLGTLRAALHRAEGGDAPLTAVAFASGVSFAVLMTAALVFFSSPAFMASDDKFQFNPNTADFILDAAYGLFVSALVLSALMPLSVALIAYRSRFVPLWVAWVSIPAGVALLFSVFFFPVIVLLVWVLLVSVVMLTRTWRAARPTETTTTAV